MKSLNTLWRVAASELAAMCRTSIARDYKTVASRVENEGLSFLTITLPAFGKDFERCLEKGRVESSDFGGFHRSRGPLPVFLGGFLTQVFDTNSGVLLDMPNIDCIFAVRQLSLMFGKILLPCSDARVRGAMERFVQVDEDVERVDQDSPTSRRLVFRRISALLFADLNTELERSMLQCELRPKHGPGATADRLRGNAKWDLTEWTQRLESVLPFGEYALPNWRYYYQLDRVTILEPGEERPVKVTPVPKTLKTPRVIAIEPTCMQYAQQALAAPLVELLESDRIGPTSVHNPVKGLIGFRDQNPNRDLARMGSVSTELATLDLSDASDRVSTSHVADLFARWPSLQEAIFATRSTKAEVPGVGLRTLAKFASMGSALCFPLEAMVFLTVAFIGIEQMLGHQLTRKDVLSFRGKMRVYGDDIIVPVDCVHHVISALESYGFVVNGSKSFWNGKFRESCGGDYYDGVDVTPVRVRRIPPTSRADVPGLVSWTATRNLFYFAGLWKTAQHLEDQIRKILPYFPLVEQTSPVLGRHSVSFGYQAEKMSSETHSPLVRGFVPVSRPPVSKISGEGALLKFFLMRGSEPLQEGHLERQGRPEAVGIKLRWCQPY